VLPVTAKMFYLEEITKEAPLSSICLVVKDANYYKWQQTLWASL
jgi:hypothetical protein